MSGSTSRLTVAVMADSEPVTLQATLESVQPLADELLVVVPRNEPSLEGILQRQRAEAVAETADNQSRSRNQLLRQATGDWVLWLESGERLALPEAEALRRHVDQPERLQAYQLLLHRSGEAQRLDDEVCLQLRLHRRRPDLQFSGRVCETMDAAVKAAGIVPGELSTRISCLNSDPVLHAERSRRIIRLARRERDEGTLRPEVLIDLGEAFFLTGKPQQSRKVYEQALEMSSPGSATMLAAYYGMLTALESCGGSRESQMEVCMQALAAYPRDAQLLCAMGGYLQASGRLDLAARSYETAWRQGTSQKAVWHLEQIREFSALCYALSLELQNQESAAIEVLEETLRDHQSPRLRRQLLQLHVKHGRLEPALEQLARLPAAVSGGPAFESAVRGACLAGQRNWIPARAHLLEAYEGGCRDPICLRWLTSTLLAVGEQNRATEVLGTWQTLHPNHPEIQGFHRALRGQGRPLGPSGIAEAG